MIDEKKGDTKPAEKPKVEKQNTFFPAKQKTVDFKVKVPFNGYNRGKIIKGVDVKKAAKWALKERGEIL